VVSVVRRRAELLCARGVAADPEELIDCGAAQVALGHRSASLVLTEADAIVGLLMLAVGLPGTGWTVVERAERSLAVVYACADPEHPDPLLTERATRWLADFTFRQWGDPRWMRCAVPGARLRDRLHDVGWEPVRGIEGADGRSPTYLMQLPAQRGDERVDEIATCPSVPGLPVRLAESTPLRMWPVLLSPAQLPPAHADHRLPREEP
jgi:hypothetical protein